MKITYKLHGYVVTAGALDEEREFRDNKQGWAEYHAWARRTIAECQAQGVDCQVYSLVGDVQYLTDHHPDYSTE